MAGPLTKYAYVNAKLRARISGILPEERFQQLEQAGSLDAALALLRETPFADLESVYANTGDLKQAELELLRGEIALYREMRGDLHASVQPVVDALLGRFEVENLKNALRVFFDLNVRGRSVEDSVHYLLHEPILRNLPIDAIVHARDLAEIAGLCHGTPYEAVLREYGPVVEADSSLFRLEVGLDRYHYANLLAAVDRLSRRDRSLARRLVGIEIDLQNLSWILRLKRYYDLPFEEVLSTLIPGGHRLRPETVETLYAEGQVTATLQDVVKDRYPGLSALLSGAGSDSRTRLQLIQRILDEINRLEVGRILSGYPFTIGIVLAYAFLKGQERRRLRTILNAKFYGHPAEGAVSGR